MRRIWVVTLLACCRSQPTAPVELRDAQSPILIAPIPVVVDASSDEASAPPPEGMLFVPGGTFTMGADHGGEEDEHPAHEVTLEGFWLDRLPVTNAEYALCVRAGACHPSDRGVALKHDSPGLLEPHHPVVGVSWDDAHAYCAWRGERLPREAEYERAERDGDGRRYPWGNEPPTPERAVFGRGFHGASTDDVGTHPAGRGPYGHDDLAGNVWEWCEDLYDPYAYRRDKPATCAEILAAQDELRAEDAQGYTGSNPIPVVCVHVLRGGGYNYEPEGLRTTNRVHHPGHFRMAVAGFRCAR